MGGRVHRDVVRWIVAALCVVALVGAVVLAVVPVSVRPSSALPSAVSDALPEALQTAEVGCGTMLSPRAQGAIDSVIGAVTALAVTDCTRAVRQRMRLVVALSVVALAALAVVVALSWGRRSEPPSVSPPKSEPSGERIERDKGPLGPGGS